MRRLVITAALLLTALAPATASAAPSGSARLLACDSALDPADRDGDVRGAHAHGARRDAAADALHAPDPQQGPGELARAPGPRLREVAEQRPRRRPLRLHEARRRPARAGVATARSSASAGSGAAASGSPRTARPRRPAARPTCAPTCARSGSTRAPGPTPSTPATSSRSSTAARPRPGRSTSSSRSTARRSRPRRHPGSSPASARSWRSRARPCTVGSMLTVDVDPTGAVDERAEADNRLTVTCPGAPA